MIVKRDLDNQSFQTKKYVTAAYSDFFQKIMAVTQFKAFPLPFIKGERGFSKMAVMEVWKSLARKGGKPGMGGGSIVLYWGDF